MPIRITGLNSGLDTEAIISALVSSYNYKTNKYKKRRPSFPGSRMPGRRSIPRFTVLYSSVGNLRLSSAYNLKSTTVSDTTKATVTASNTAPSGTQTPECYQCGAGGISDRRPLDSSVSTGTTLAELWLYRWGR